MYDELIIAEIQEKIKKERENQRPYLELPVPERVSNNEVSKPPEPKRVVIIDTLDTECDDEYTFDI